ncbi:MAG: T9SS type A sorting domain-containing protein [Saprospiraceae bacterium]
MNKILRTLAFCICSHLLSAQTAPSLPNTSSIETCFPDTAGYTILTVGPVGRDYSDLQLAINAANPGTILVLDAGASFKGSFSLPNKTGNGWIILTSSHMNLLPGHGIRIAPTAATGNPGYPIQQAAMPKIITTNASGLPCFKTQADAHHYRLVGLEITADPSVLNSYGLVFFGDANQSTLSVVPHDLIVDRCYIHGHTDATIMKSGVLLNCANAAVIESYIADFHSIGFDTYAIGGTNGPGPFIIRNNYLEAAGENILFGGAASSIPGLVPSDIEVLNNHFFKPFSWRVGHPTYAGKHWTIKNLFELKTGRRVLLDGNVLENCWADLPIGQSGYAILLTVRTEGGGSPFADVSDITITNNLIRHAGAGISLSGHDSPTPSLQSKRIRIANNLFDDISGPDYGDGNVNGPNDGTFLKIGDPDDVLLEHNTVLQTGPITWTYDTTEQIAMRNNLFQCFISDGGYQGIYGPGFAQGGNGPMGRYFPGITDANQKFHKNVLIGGDAFRYSNYNTLSLNYFPANPAAVQFVNFANGGSDYSGYTLANTSPYKNAATDGRDIGVDFVQLDNALNRIVDCGPTVGVGEPLEFGEIRFFPNPFRGRVTIASKRELKGAELVVLDFLGREVKRMTAITGQMIEISGLEAEVYFWTLREDGKDLGCGKVIGY